MNYVYRVEAFWRGTYTTLDVTRHVVASDAVEAIEKYLNQSDNRQTADRIHRVTPITVAGADLGVDYV